MLFEFHRVPGFGERCWQVAETQGGGMMVSCGSAVMMNTRGCMEARCGVVALVLLKFRLIPGSAKRSQVADIQ
jgi:hypothetical protein